MNMQADKSKNQKAARAEIIARCREFTSQYHAAENRIDAARATIEVAEAEKVELLKRVNDCMAAARVLDFDLIASMRSEGDDDADFVGSIDPSAGQHQNGPSIRDVVLEVSRKAFPGPVRASKIRKHIENLRGTPLHEKTIGMTLYRLSKDGLMYRRGIDWFYCGQPEGNK